MTQVPVQETIVTPSRGKPRPQIELRVYPMNGTGRIFIAANGINRWIDLLRFGDTQIMVSDLERFVESIDLGQRLLRMPYRGVEARYKDWMWTWQLSSCMPQDPMTNPELDIANLTVEERQPYQRYIYVNYGMYAPANLRADKEEAAAAARATSLANGTLQA